MKRTILLLCECMKKLFECKEETVSTDTKIRQLVPSKEDITLLFDSYGETADKVCLQLTEYYYNHEAVVTNNAYHQGSNVDGPVHEFDNSTERIIKANVKVKYAEFFPMTDSYPEVFESTSICEVQSTSIRVDKIPWYKIVFTDGTEHYRRKDDFAQGVELHHNCNNIWSEHNSNTNAQRMRTFLDVENDEYVKKRVAYIDYSKLTIRFGTIVKCEWEKSAKFEMVPSNNDLKHLIHFDGVIEDYTNPGSKVEYNLQKCGWRDAHEWVINEKYLSKTKQFQHKKTRVFTQSITIGSEIHKELLNASLVPLKPSLLNPAIDEAWGQKIRCKYNHADGSCHADLGTCNSEQFSRINTYKCRLGFHNTCLLKCDRSQLMQRLFTKEAQAKFTNHVKCLECNNASTGKQAFACENNSQQLRPTM